MFQRSTTKPLVKAVSVLGILVLLAGCGTPAKTKAEKADSGPQPKSDASIAKELLPFYEQKVAWKACSEEDKSPYCANIEVPADWSKPAGDRLKIAIAYRKADVGSPLGSILINPGGPGLSGVSIVRDQYQQIGTALLRNNFNIVSFDPRGVGASEPKIRCLSRKEKKEEFSGASSAEPGSAEAQAEIRAANKKFADACLKNTGPNLQFIDTVSVARDIDVIRAVFGDSKIHYFGYSYGTHLGNTYAALFPKRVGRMVLDSVAPPTYDKDFLSFRVKGVDDDFNKFLTDCLSKKDCPFTGDLPSARSQVAKLLRSIEKKPLKTDSDRVLTIAGASELIWGFSDESYWPMVEAALNNAIKGDGTLLLELADTFRGVDESDLYSGDAYLSIKCADDRAPTDAASLATENKSILAASPVWGRYMQFESLSCESWPYPAAKKLESYAATGSDKILVIGTTGDPATPYRWSVTLATKILANAQLVTFHGKVHGAYGRDNACINKTVDDYLIKGIVPTKDPQCKKAE